MRYMKIKHSVLFRVFAAVSSLAVLAACSSLPLPPPGSDAALSAEIRERLSNDGLTDDLNIGVSVSGGIVTLNGNVFDPAARARAKDIVRGVEGIKGVVDNLVTR